MSDNLPPPPSTFTLTPEAFLLLAHAEGVRMRGLGADGRAFAFGPSDFGALVGIKFRLAVTLLREAGLVEQVEAKYDRAGNPEAQFWLTPKGRALLTRMLGPWAIVERLEIDLA